MPTKTKQPFAGLSSVKPEENPNEQLNKEIAKISNSPKRVKTSNEEESIGSSENSKAQAESPKTIQKPFENFFIKQHGFEHSSNVTISRMNLARMKIITGIEDIPVSHTIDEIISWWFDMYDDDIKKNGFDRIFKKKLK